MTLFTKKSDENKNEETISTLGTRIAGLRKEKGYTQEEFSDMLGVSAQAVSKWENDLSCPDIMLIPQIASIFDIKQTNFSRENLPKKKKSKKLSAFSRLQT